MSTAHWSTKYIWICIPAQRVASLRDFLDSLLDSLSFRLMKIIYFQHNGFVRIKWYTSVKWLSWESILWNLVCSICICLRAVTLRRQKYWVQVSRCCAFPYYPGKKSHKGEENTTKGDVYFLHCGVRGKGYLLSTI